MTLAVNHACIRILISKMNKVIVCCSDMLVTTNSVALRKQETKYSIYQLHGVIWLDARSQPSLCEQLHEAPKQ